MTSNKFNRKFNRACSRFAFWSNLRSQVSGLSYNLRPFDFPNPDDLKALQRIQSLLLQVQEISISRSRFHSQALLNLRKEFKS